MGERHAIRSADLLRLMRHLADVAALRGDTGVQHQVLIDGLNRILRTHSSFLYVAEDWRVGRAARFARCTLATGSDPVFVRYTTEFGVNFPLDDDPFCYCSTRDRAARPVYTLSGVMPGRQTQRRHANFMDLCSTTKLRDGVVSFYRTGPGGDRIIGVGMHRLGDGRRIAPHEVELVRVAIDELRGLAERGHLETAPVASTRLAPRLSQVLDCLLAGHAPKSIARDLGISLWTVREYVQRLYQLYQVSGREELMARFIGEFGTLGRSGRRALPRPTPP
jgi:DNA-binding CsgD family transcriptional regulator